MTNYSQRLIRIYRYLLPSDRLTESNSWNGGGFALTPDQPPSFPYRRSRTYPLFCVSARAVVRGATWKLAVRIAPTVSQALINGAPVAAPVTMQFALRARAV